MHTHRSLSCTSHIIHVGIQTTSCKLGAPSLELQYNIPPVASSNQSASCWQTISFSVPSLKPGECHRTHITLTKMNAAAAPTSQGLQLNDFGNLLHQNRPAAWWHNAYLSKYCRELGSYNLFVYVNSKQVQSIQNTHTMDSGIKCFVLWWWSKKSSACGNIKDLLFFNLLVWHNWNWCL